MPLCIGLTNTWEKRCWEVVTATWHRTDQYGEGKMWEDVTATLESILISIVKVYCMHGKFFYSISFIIKTVMHTVPKMCVVLETQVLATS